MKIRCFLVFLQDIKRRHEPKVIKSTTDFFDEILWRSVAANIPAIKLSTIIKHKNQTEEGTRGVL